MSSEISYFLTASGNSGKQISVMGRIVNRKKRCPSRFRIYKQLIKPVGLPARPERTFWSPGVPRESPGLQPPTPIPWVVGCNTLSWLPDLMSSFSSVTHPLGPETLNPALSLHPRILLCVPCFRPNCFLGLGHKSGNIIKAFDRPSPIRKDFVSFHLG